MTRESDHRNRMSKAIVAALPVLTVTSVFMSPSVSAAPFTYDAVTTDTSPSTAQDGAGAGWNTTNVNWLDGATSSNVVWPDTLTETAIFGATSAGTGGNVVVGTVNVGTIQFNPQTTTGYTLSGAASTITLGTGIVNNNAALTSTISAKISGSAGLAYSGTGTGAVNLSNNSNDYTGITQLSGTARIGNGANNALGSSAGASASTLGTNYTQVGTGTGVTFTGQTVAEAFIINGSAQSNAGALRFSNNTTLNSLIQLGSNSLIFGAFSTGNTLNGNIDLQSFTLSTGNAGGTINGVIGGTGNVTLGSSSAFTFTNTANSFSGNLTLNSGGAVGLGSDGVLGTSTLVFGGGTIRSTDATARTINNVIGTLTGNANFGATTVQTGTLSFTSNTVAALGSSRTFVTNVNTTFANGFSGTATQALTKTGAATLFLNGANTYGGLTTVSTGTLGGTGSFVGAVTVASGATLAPGNSPGIVTVGGSVTLSGGSNFSVELQGLTAGTGYDQLSLTGTAGSVTLTDANLIAAFSLFTPTAGGGDQLYIINNVDDARTVVGTFAGLADNAPVATYGGETFLITYDANSATGALDGGNDVALYSVAVPEPTAIAILSVVGMGLLRRRSRR